MQFRNVIVLSAALLAPGASFAAPVVSEFDSNDLTSSYSLDPIDIGFSINFFGREYSQLYVTAEGAVTFDAGTVVEGSMAHSAFRVLAPFSASNVDIRFGGSQVTYGGGTYDGQAAFGVNWVDTDYFGNGLGYSDTALKMTYRFANPDDIHAARNSYQLIIVDRSEGNSFGDFDFIFNYDSIQWQNYGVHVGWSNKSADFFEIGGDLRDIDLYGAFLDGGPLALAGLTYTFQVRNGIVSSPIITNTPTIPEPETWAMLLAGLGVVGASAKRRRRQG